MATKKRLDQLPAILGGSVGNNDLMYLVHENAQAETGYDSEKILVSEVAKKMLGGVELPTDLPDFPSGEQNAIDALNYLRDFLFNQLPVNSASGSLATFTTTLALPLPSAKFGIVASQESGTPTPSSPKAITGYTGINVKHSGADTSDYTTYPVSWQTEAGTVYGGEVDVTTGKLSVTHAIVNMEDLNWNYVSANQYFQVAKPSGASTNIALLCTCYKYTGSTVDNLSIFQTGSYFRVQDTDYTTATAFKTAVTGQKICYGLATPLEYDLTPVEITALVGTNNIWGDTNGNAEVEYKQGIQEYIDAKIAETQALIL